MPASVAEAIFGKFNPHYTFPEGHAVAFTAYQMAWLRRYHTLEFFVALFNEQAMGFWDLETLKRDARWLGLRVAHPDVNRSSLLCTAEGDDTLRLGLTFVKGVTTAWVKRCCGGEQPRRSPTCRTCWPGRDSRERPWRIWPEPVPWTRWPAAPTGGAYCGR